MAVKSEFYCVKCGRFQPRKEFYLNYNEYLKEYNDGRMLYCISCAKEISRDIMSRYWNVQTNKDDKLSYELGIRATCTFFMMPYLNEAMNIVRDNEINSTKPKDWNYVYQYMVAIKELEIPKEYWNDLSCNNFMAIDLLHVAKTTQNGDTELLTNLNRDWGIQDCIEDYLFLEERFKIYTENETPNSTMINVIRYLCQAELDVRKLKNNNADINEITKAEKRVTDYYVKLKLDDFKFNKSKSEQEKLIEQWANITENMEPIEWEDENLKDRLGIDEDYDDIMRAMSNKIVGTKEYPTLTLEDAVKEKNNKKKKGRKK